MKPIENTSGIHPQGHAVLLQPFELEEKQSAIIIPDDVREAAATRETMGYVIAVGAAAWSDEPRPRAKVGDLVLHTKYGGGLCKGRKDGKIYRMIPCDCIYATIEE